MHPLQLEYFLQDHLDQWSSAGPLQVVIRLRSETRTLVPTCHLCPQHILKFSAVLWVARPGAVDAVWDPWSVRACYSHQVRLLASSWLAVSISPGFLGVRVAQPQRVHVRAEGGKGMGGEEMPFKAF